MKAIVSAIDEIRKYHLDLFIVLLFVFEAVITINYRGLFPFDETRYMSVAWEMWLHNDFPVPRLNGNIYADKPPLLFWLINIGWFITGVNEWFPRSIPFVFSVVNICLTRYIAMQLWPNLPRLRVTIPLVMAAMPLWLFYSTPLMFDMMQVFFVLVAIVGLMHFNHKYRGPLIFGIAIGLGFLLKGPVIFIYVIPLAVTLPLWNKSFSSGTTGLVVRICFAVVISAIVILMWIIPVIRDIGVEKTLFYFWSQTADRIVNASSHSRPAWWYLYFAPLILFPWFFRVDLPRFIKTIHCKPGSQLLFCMIWIFIPLLFFMLIDAKQLHYLLPLIPAVSIITGHLMVTSDPLSARRIYRPTGIIYMIAGILFFYYANFAESIAGNTWIANVPAWWTVIAIFSGVLLIFTPYINPRFPELLPALVSIVVCFSVYTCVLIAPRPFTPIDNFSRMLASLQLRNIPLVSIGGHREQFRFPGRMEYPIEKIEKGKAARWAEKHPDGYLIAEIKSRDLTRKNINPVYSQPYRLQHMLILISSREVLGNNYNL